MKCWSCWDFLSWVRAGEGKCRHAGFFGTDVSCCKGENWTQTIDSLVTNYPDCHATALIIDKFVIKSRGLAEVEKMYESLTPRIKNAYLGRKLKDLD